MIGDPYLNYFALGVLVFVVVVLFYGIIAIHDIPHLIAKSRNHPHQDAIHAAGWASLFTLHALWPFLWIWAMVYRPESGWGGTAAPAVGVDQPASLATELEHMRERIAHLESKAKIENNSGREPPSREPPNPELKTNGEQPFRAGGEQWTSY